MAQTPEEKRLSFETSTRVESTIAWTPEEERRARLKLDFVVMPLLMLGFFVLQMDRGNISNALTDNFLEDVGITQDQFNIGQQLMSLGIVIFEIPANLLLYKVGPQKWLSLQVVAFGLVSTFQAWQSSYGSFLATRFLLGCTESAYIPGGLYTLTTWYTKSETATRVTVFFVGNLSASATTNLISYGILHMRGVGGMTGWQWLLILMGLFTITSGFVLALLLPDSVRRPRPWLLPRITYFTERERYILEQRLLADDPGKGNLSSGRPHIRWSDVRAALTTWRLYPHILITLTNNGPLTAFNNYGPSLIRGFGYEALQANALASVGPWILVLVAVFLSWISDRWTWRAQTTIAALSAHLAFMIMDQQVASSASRGLRYAGVVLTQSVNFAAHPLNIAWMTVHTKTPTERVIAMALIIMSANSAGIYGAQLFRSDDAPSYPRAFTVNVALLAAGLATALALALYYWTAARRQRYA